MDVIREHLMYKNSPLNICMATISLQEQYEIIRIILESKAEVTVCPHNSTNKYIDILLNKMNIVFRDCSIEHSERRQFHHQMACTPFPR